MAQLGLTTSQEQSALSDGKYAVLFQGDKLIVGIIPEAEEGEFQSAIVITQDPDGSTHLAIVSDKIGINGVDLAINALEVTSHSDVESKRKGTVYTLAGDPSLYIKKTEPVVSV